MLPVFVTASGEPVNWGTAVVGGVATVDIFKVVDNENTPNDSRRRWASAGQSVPAWKVTSAKQQQAAAVEQPRTATNNDIANLRNDVELMLAKAPGATDDAVSELVKTGPKTRSSLGAAYAQKPSGGTDGQALVKSGSGTAWATVSGGGAVADASTTSKGVVQLAGDLAGTAATPTVIKLNGATPAAVATSGAYADLVGRPNLAAVATSGSAADLTGVLPQSALPPLAINDTFVVASQAAMLALSAQRGDMAVRTDLAPTRMFVLTSEAPSTLANWVEVTAAGSVLSVAGRQGAVTLTKTDVGLDQVANLSPTALAASGDFATTYGQKADVAANSAAIAALAPGGKVTASKVRRVPVLSSVATRNNPLGQGTQAPPAGLSVTYRTQHTITADCFDLRAVFGNFQYASAGAVEADGANAITVRAAIELTAGGTRRPFSFNGVRSASVEPGFAATADPLPLSFKAGDTLWVWTNVSIASGTWPIGLQIVGSQAPTTGTPYPSITSGEGSNFSANTGDVTLTGTVNQQSMACYSPIALLARTATPVPVVAVVGDSIAAGFGDSPTYDWGFAIRALAPASVSHLNLSHKGETAAQYAIALNNMRRNRLVEHCTHALVNYGTNDLAQNNQTYLQIATNLIAIWRAFAIRGLPVYQATICPRTTSTDSWATLANQTIVAGCGQPRTDLNAWLRAGAPVNGIGAPVAVGTAGAVPCPFLTGVFDTALGVEDGTSGLWKVSPAATTSDGVHPNVAGHTAMSGYITPGVFTI